MKLANVAKRFDKTVAADAYNPVTTFKCQLAPLDLFRIEGTAVKKRQLTTAPDVVIPARRTISIDGDVYLIGDDSADHWRNQRIRNNYVLQGADFIASVYTVAQALNNDAPLTAWAALNFNKNQTDERQNSDYHSQYNIYFANGETAPADSLITDGTRWFLIRQSYTSVSGLVVTLANEINAPAFETISFKTRTYVPATDSYTEVSTNVKLLRIRWTEWFEYLSAGTAKFVSGDMMVTVLKSAITPKAGDTLALSDGNWKVIAVQDDAPVWSVHVRRA